MSPSATLDDLRAALLRAEGQLELCDWIDDWNQVQHCKATWRAEIARINAEIVRLQNDEESRSPRAAKLWRPGQVEGD